MALLSQRSICIIPSICFLLYISLSAQDDVIRLYYPEVFGGAGRGPVFFSHGKHMAEFDCLRCHHKFNRGKNIIELNDLYTGNNEIKCASCHSQETKFNLEEAFHTQCMGCHRIERRSGRKKAPIFCAHCHPIKRQKEK